MPLRRKLTALDDYQWSALRDRLAQEIASPQETEPEPILVEDTSLGGLRLYVIWSRWGNLDQRVRSEIITDAFTQAKGKLALPQLVVAMGLTPQEAQRMGIRYE
jgi:hypothetical protein